MAMELWKHGGPYDGGDLVALLVVEDDEAQTAAVVGSVVYRSGPLTPEMRELLEHLLPPVTNGVLGGLRQRWRRQRLAGMVHVYVDPQWRGGGRGKALTRFSLEALSRRGFTHVLTYADDGGSGELRAWYADLGFVGAEEFDDRAMVARTA